MSTLTIGLDLKGLLQPKRSCDSMISVYAGPAVQITVVPHLSGTQELIAD